MILLDDRVVDSKGRTSKSTNGYAPWSERYNNLLDTVYAYIVETRISANAKGLKYAKNDRDKASPKVNLASDMSTRDASK